MTSRLIRLLHVEDDPIEQRVLAHHLKNLSDLHFEITAAATEAAALQAVDAQAFDLVVLDYQLAAGNGLHLLREIRARDELIPVIAISGVATSEIALELIQSGADDYFRKSEVAPARLAESIRVTLHRSESVRKRTPQDEAPGSVTIEQLVYEMCRNYGAASPPRMLRMLDDVEEGCRQAHCHALELEQLFDSACDKLDAEAAFGAVSTRRLVRPLYLEMSTRLLSGEPLAHLN